MKHYPLYLAIMWTLLCAVGAVGLGLWANVLEVLR